MKRSYLRHYNKQLLIIYAILLTLIIAGLWYVTNLRDKKPIAAGDLMQISAQLTEPPISEFTTKDGKQSLSIIYFELEGYPQVSFVLTSFALKATLVDESLQMGKVGDLITIAAKKSDMAQLNRLGTIKIYELSHNHRPYLTLEGIRSNTGQI
ncbi:MAG: hypothetical protein IPN33_07050 [Saprospiraceae bacterium]|nr:hypothetical protein [Saprospiraceae bacterium]